MSNNIGPLNYEPPWLPRPASWFFLGGIFLGVGVGGFAEHASNIAGGVLMMLGGILTVATVAFQAAQSAKWLAGIMGVGMVVMGAAYLVINGIATGSL